MDRDQMRASEADRQLVMDQLRQAVEDGRLDVAEYQARVDAALNAKVYSELDVLVADLQRLAPPGFHAEATVPNRAARLDDPHRFPQTRDGDSADRARRWRRAGVITGIAAVIALVVIVVFPELLLYIAITVLVVLVLFVIAGVLGLF
jgi:hypothetical protein